MAICRASATRSARRWLAIGQPAMRRLHASSTTARPENPAAVGAKVMPATRNSSGRSERAVRQVRRRPGALVAPGRHRAVPPAACGQEAGIAHQPGRALASMPFPGCPQTGMRAGRAIGLARGGAHDADPLPQRRVSRGVGRDGAAKPRVVAGLGRTGRARHDADGDNGLVRAHELDDPDGTAPVSRGNQTRAPSREREGRPAAARERMPRSKRKCLFSRRSRVSSSRSPGASWRSGFLPSGRPAPAPGLEDPGADRLGARLEPSGQIDGITPGTHQIDHLLTELRGMRETGFRHEDTFRESVRGLHQTGARSTSIGDIPSAESEARCYAQAEAQTLAA